MRNGTAPWLALAVACGISTRAAAEGGPFRPLDLVLEAPTFRCLGVRLYGEDDAEGKARAILEFRKAGSGPWKKAIDLLRVEGERCDPPLAHELTKQLTMDGRGLDAREFAAGYTERCGEDPVISHWASAPLPHPSEDQ